MNFRMNTLVIKSVSGLVVVSLAAAVSAISFSSGASAGAKLFSYKGKTYSSGDMEATVKQSIFEADQERYASLNHVIDTYLLEAHIKAEAKRKKMKVEDLRHEMFAAKPATEVEMKAWFEKNKEKIPYPYDKIKNEIKRMLAGEKSNEIRTELIRKIKTDGKFKNLLPEPVAPIFSIASKGYPSKGSASAQVTLVEFADYQCPHCRAATGVVKNILKKYGSKVKLVYLDYPVNRSGISREIAVGAVCADQQDKFWKYHYMAFEKQSELTKDAPTKFAKELGLDTKKFEVCLKSSEARAKVAKSEAEGKRVGVSGTPTFFINGKKMHAGDEKQFSIAIDKALKRVGT